jgi:hypothetical protein
MSYATEFDAMVERLRAFRAAQVGRGDGCRPTLLLFREEGGVFRAGRARLVGAAGAAAEVQRALADDPLLSDGGKALRKMRAAAVVAQCRRLGVDPVRPGMSKRMLPKRDLIARLLATREESE